MTGRKVPPGTGAKARLMIAMGLITRGGGRWKLPGDRTPYLIHLGGMVGWVVRVPRDGPYPGRWINCPTEAEGLDALASARS